MCGDGRMLFLYGATSSKSNRHVAGEKYLSPSENSITKNHPGIRVIRRRTSQRRGGTEVRLSQRDSESACERDAAENWWDYCPICNARLINQKCKYVCSDQNCHFFMSCSEFDL
jgi:hypothetical protein